MREGVEAIAAIEGDAVSQRSSEQSQMRSLRICRVTHALYPDVIGGHAIFCHELSERQERMGHNVEVLTALRNNLPKRQLVNGNYWVSRFKKVWMPWDSLGMSNPLTPGLHSTVRRTECDLVDAHSHLFWTSALAVKAALTAGRPVVTTVHGVLALRDWLANTSQLLYLRSIGRWTLRNSSRVVCLTKSDAAEVKELGVSERTIRVIPIAVDPTRFKPRSNRRQVILWVGRIVHEKGLETLLHAVAEMKKKRSAHVLIVGNGPLRGKLIKQAHKERISDCVTFIPSATRMEVERLLGESKIFVLPSRKEGLPSTLLEAMASGNMIVASDLPAMREVLDDAGLYFTPDRADELAEVILRALKDRQLCNRKGREARELARERYSWDVVLPRLEQLYQEVV